MNKLLPKGVYLLPDCVLGKPLYVNKENLDRFNKGLDCESSYDFTRVVVSKTPEDDLSILTGVSTFNIGKIDKGAKYKVTIRNRYTGECIEVDTYDMLEALKITCPSMAHAFKKIANAGKRGVKDFNKDCDEAINSIEQSKLLEKFRK